MPTFTIIFYYVRKENGIAVLNRLECMGANAQLSVSVLDELVEAIPSVVVLVLGQIVVEGLVNGFEAWLDGIADDI